MSINNPREYVDNLWDWKVLDGCFGRVIKPSDIDGHVERKGFFLYLETKSPTAELKEGQEISITNRVRDGISTHMVIWGNPGEPQVIWVYRPAPKHQNNPEKYPNANLTTLQRLCRDWFAAADDYRRPWGACLAEAAGANRRGLKPIVAPKMHIHVPAKEPDWQDPGFKYNDMFRRRRDS